MTELRCEVNNCTYNDSNCCCKGDICVAGVHADEKGKTCCESFSNRKNDAFTSSISHASDVIGIDCEAIRCIYNSNYRCKAKKVDILGNGAKNSEGTACGTFTER